MIHSNVTWLQRLLSYVMEVPVITVEGEYNPTLRVSLVQNRFQLSTEHAIYSFDDYYLNFSRAFKKIDLPADGAEMLLLGLGLGSVPYILEKQYNRKYHTTAVELDEAVIALASAFTFPRLSTRIEVVHADAEVYIQNVQRSFDLIVVDLFLDDVIPPYFEQKEGLQQLRKLLKPAGLILINRLYRNTSDRQKTGNFYRNTFLKVFNNGYHIEVMGNWILVGKG
jgi:SAM-dependent methyltransferase